MFLFIWIGSVKNFNFNFTSPSSPMSKKKDIMHIGHTLHMFSHLTCCKCDYANPSASRSLFGLRF